MMDIMPNGMYFEIVETELCKLMKPITNKWDFYSTYTIQNVR